MNAITETTLQERLANATTSLLKLARDSSWNKISDNCLYVVSEIEDSTLDFFELRKLRKQNNDLKMPLPLANVMPQLLEVYDNLYDINLYVYRAKKDVTIIEIAYYPKTSLIPDYKETVINNSPMLHCKVGIPGYIASKKNRSEKFDINWELNPLNYRLRMFWMRLKYKMGIRTF